MDLNFSDWEKVDLRKIFRENQKKAGAFVYLHTRVLPEYVCLYRALACDLTATIYGVLGQKNGTFPNEG